MLLTKHAFQAEVLRVLNHRFSQHFLPAADENWIIYNQLLPIIELRPTHSNFSIHTNQPKLKKILSPYYVYNIVLGALED